MNKVAIQKLFAKTAQVLRQQEHEISTKTARIAELESESEKTASKERAFALAKTACIRGIIDPDIESVEKYAQDILASGKNLDVVDEALKMASVAPSFDAVDELHTGPNSGRIDPITEVLFGIGG